MSREPARPRRTQHLHDWVEPVAARPAATLLLVRDGPPGLEVLMARRAATARFAPGAHVFPGGAVDEQDRQAATRLLSARPAALDSPEPDVERAAFAVAAIREAFEEVGVLLADDAQGAPIDAAASAGLSRTAALLPALETRGWRPAIDRLHWFSHWVTDRDLPRRFDARFFVAEAPADCEHAADGCETFESQWVHPSQALADDSRESLCLIFPTIRTLQALRRFDTVAALLAHCARQQRPQAECARAGLLGDEVQRFTADEPPFGELALVAPDGRVLHRLDWQSERPVRLTRSVSRLTAPNASMMTGPGTNTYVVGDARDCVVIDPGPADEAHTERLAGLVDGRLRAILCTHSHPDHSPGARLLQQRVAAPVLGMRSAPGVPAAWAFEPDRELVDGERLVVGDCTLRAIHTPGHMSNHLCFVLEEDGLLFSGDHVLNGSTTVVDPTDGDMTDYLASLRRLRAQAVEFILPAHGHVLAPAGAAIDRLIAHRLAREAKVHAALGPAPGTTLAELVRVAYAEVPAALHAVAERSLLAHLLKLARDGSAVTRDGRWWSAG